LATDATGTPTPLGIPTYNINVDAPSGNGNNAQMQAIDALLQARATVASPAFSGNPTAPTPVSTDNDTSIATTAFVQNLLSALVPSGTMMQFAGSAAPTGWLLADGSAVSRTTYSSLYAAIGTTYGSGDGSTTFNVPDLRGRIPVGKNTGTFSALGDNGGEETHVLSQAEMPSHNHTFSGSAMGAHSHTFSGDALPAHAHSYQEAIGNAQTAGTGSDMDATTAANTSSVSAGTPSGSISSNSAGTPAGTISNAGSGSAHNNLQPYLVVNHIIKT
jgi:microcystin-dependent protein